MPVFFYEGMFRGNGFVKIDTKPRRIRQFGETTVVFDGRAEEQLIPYRLLGATDFQQRGIWCCCAKVQRREGTNSAIRVVRENLDSKCVGEMARADFTKRILAE